MKRACKRTYLQRLYQIHARKRHYAQKTFKSELFCDWAWVRLSASILVNATDI
jgi:hypothetical protein